MSAYYNNRSNILESTIFAADLFCGLGGFSSGLIGACKDFDMKPQLVAVNHWAKAIETHKTNHPEVHHLCDDLNTLCPLKAVPGGRLDVLLASPECTHFSNARGGKPMDDQSRTSAQRVIEWCTSLEIQHVIIENVKEFRTWGPLYQKGPKKGRPIEKQKGVYFRRFIKDLEKLGYHVDNRLLNSADYGAATARTRLFIQANKQHAPRWPESTHAETATLFGHERYRPAREIIDWSIKGKSIFGRKKPLSDKTLKRIEAGLEKFCGLSFTLGQQSCSAPRSVEEPIATISTAGAISLIEPFLVKFKNNQDAESINEPLGTLTTKDCYGLVEPYLVVLRNNADAQSLDEPAPTITAGGLHLGVAEPFIVKMFGTGEGTSDLDDPLPTATTGRNRFYLVQPFVIPVTHGGGEQRVHDIGEPLPTVTGARRGELALVEPFIIPFRGERDGQAPRCHSINEPAPTICTANGHALIEPFIVKFYGTGGAVSCDEPLPTVTTNDRFGLCEVFPLTIFERDGVWYALLDIFFRMLKPHELAVAMGLGDYKLTGTQEEQTKMIGNAVERNTAKALCKIALEDLLSGHHEAVRHAELN